MSPRIDLGIDGVGTFFPVLGSTEGGWFGERREKGMKEEREGGGSRLVAVCGG